MNNLKKVIASIIVFSMIFSSFALIPPVAFAIDGTPTIEIYNGQTDININAEFDVVVKVSDITTTSAQVAVKYDPNVVKVVDADGNIVADDTQNGLTQGANNGILVSANVNNTQGLVKYALMWFAPHVVGNTAEDFVTMRFKAIATGNPNIHFATQAGDTYYDATAPEGYVVANAGQNTVCNLTEPAITVHDPELEAATAAVEAAEASMAQADVNTAQPLVTALPDGAMKTSLQTRIDAVQDIIDATAAVEAAETSKAQADVTAAQPLVTALPDGAVKTELQARLNNVQAEINAAAAIADATAAVEAAEASLAQADITTAQPLVTALPDGATKTSLQIRIDAVQAIIDATAAVVQAETSKAQADVTAAQPLVTALPDGAVKTELQTRLNNVQAEINAAAAIADATAAVEAAEASLAQADVTTAQPLVTALPTGTTKTSLQARLDAVQDIIDATAAVVTAEANQTQASVDAAELLVNALPAGDVKNALVTRLAAVQAAIDEANAIIAATAAVATAETNKTQAGLDAALGLVTALPNGTEKTQLQSRLDALQLVVNAMVAIDALPAAAAVTINDEAAIAAARTLVTTANNDAAITNLTKLAACEDRLYDLQNPLEAINDLLWSKCAALDSADKTLLISTFTSLDNQDTLINRIQALRAQDAALDALLTRNGFTGATELAALSQAIKTAILELAVYNFTGADTAQFDAIYNDLIAALPQTLIDRMSVYGTQEDKARIVFTVLETILSEKIGAGTATGISLGIVNPTAVLTAVNAGLSPHFVWSQDVHIAAMDSILDALQAELNAGTQLRDLLTTVGLISAYSAPSTGGGGGGGVTEPTEETNNEQVVNDIEDTTGTINSDLDSTLNSSDATDSDISSAVSTATETLTNDVVTNIEKITDSTQAEAAVAEAAETISLLAEATARIQTADQALAAAQSVAAAAGAIIKAAETTRAENIDQIVNSVVTAANAAIEKAGQIAAGAVQVQATETAAKVTVDAAAVTAQIQQVLQTANTLTGTLQQNNLTQAVQKVEKAIAITVAKEQVKDTVEVGLAKETMSTLQENNVNVVVNMGAVQFKINPAALPLEEVDGQSTINIQVTKPENAAEKVAKKEIHDEVIGAEVKELNVIAQDAQGNSKVLSKNLKDKIKVGISLAGVDLKKVDLEKVAPKYYNETTAKWETVPGAKYNAATNAIEFYVNHLSTYTLMQVNKEFADVTGRWSERYVEVAYAKGIIKGVDETSFAPQANVTRAEFAAMLVRTLGLKVAAAEAQFADVAQNAWYAQEVATAYDAGLINGVGANSFAPNANITREEMATMIGRALTAVKGINAVRRENIGKRIGSYTDKTAVSDWADEHFALTVREGIINGMSDATLAPQALATREQAAKMMKLVFDK